MVEQEKMALNWQRAGLDAILGRNALLWGWWNWLPRETGCFNPCSFQGQVGWCLEQPGLVEAVSAHWSGVGARWPLRSFQPNPFHYFTGIVTCSKESATCKTPALKALHLLGARLYNTKQLWSCWFNAVDFKRLFRKKNIFALLFLQSKG